jgi:hypothetical protein
LLLASQLLAVASLLLIHFLWCIHRANNQKNRNTKIRPEQNKEKQKEGSKKNKIRLEDVSSGMGWPIFSPPPRTMLCKSYSILSYCYVKGCVAQEKIFARQKGDIGGALTRNIWNAFNPKTYVVGQAVILFVKLTTTFSKISSTLKPSSADVSLFSLFVRTTKEITIKKALKTN